MMTMTTKPPSSVKKATEPSLEKIAYAAVAGLPVVEPHDLDRLGYNVWLWLKNRRDPFEVAVKTASARLQISEEEAVQRIRTRLQELGVEL
jgi:hypothetical protein